MNFSPTIFRFLASLVEFHHNTLTREMSIQIGYTCHLLEVLSIIPLFGSTCRVQKRSVTVDTVTPILTSCPRLRIFDGDFLELHASNVPEHPWVCTKLQVLKCQIVGIQYLASGDEKELDELGPDTEVTNKWLEACLNQLKSITSLKRPDHKNATDEVLSTYISKRDDKLYYKYPDPHRDTLSMKLSDGLDQLGTLTRLEYLGFECVRHRMEKEEIEWIAANLPSLKEMRGLADDIHIGLELDPKKKQLRELMETLRKDIIHTQSFTKDMVFFRE
ncbi:hypothetical protein BGZ76_002456 [Entomortierella beljakovae]|nr:hypothetical protein BGZ76_002456 [Entomortierella beljakovae]